VSSLTTGQASLHREDFEVDTRPFSTQVAQGDWGGQAAFLAEKSSEIHEKVTSLGDAEIHYFGLAEVPHVIALGAFIGDEVPVQIHDFDRDRTSWAWPETKQTLSARIVGLPTGSVVPAPGSVVLRVALSFPISDKDVQEVAGIDHLADITITLAEGLDPAICKVRSSADLQEVRLKIRDALAAIRTRFPNLDTLLVFVAAPVSVCFALGQELKPRNSPPIQTYRYRKVEGQPAYTPAIELSSDLEARVEAPLTTEDLETVRLVRELWSGALADVEHYASTKSVAPGMPIPKWYEPLDHIPEVLDVRPYPPLPLLSALVPAGARVDPTSFPVEYEFATPENIWRLNDRLLLGLHDSTGRNADDSRRLIRVFLFHEYLHAYHSLTAYRALGIGAFPNCLEHADYAADAYAVIHQVDMETSAGAIESDEKKRAFLVEQLERVVLSFWAFESQPPVREWQVRRFRRYLNWYWRLTQVRHAPDLKNALRLLAHAPHVEIAGLHQFARGQRVYCRIDRMDTRTRPELALILENEKILRVPDSTTSNLNQLLIAFQQRQHDAIVRFFKGVYERAQELGGALPSA